MRALDLEPKTCNVCHEERAAPLWCSLIAQSEHLNAAMPILWGPRPDLRPYKITELTSIDIGRRPPLQERCSALAESQAVCQGATAISVTSKVLGGDEPRAACTAQNE